MTTSLIKQELKKLGFVVNDGDDGWLEGSRADSELILGFKIDRSISRATVGTALAPDPKPPKPGESAFVLPATVGAAIAGAAIAGLVGVMAIGKAIGSLADSDRSPGQEGVVFKAYVAKPIPQGKIARIIYECNRYHALYYSPFAVYVNMAPSGTSQLCLSGKFHFEDSSDSRNNPIGFVVKETDLFQSRFRKHLEW